MMRVKGVSKPRYACDAAIVIQAHARPNACVSSSLRAQDDILPA